MTIIEGMRSIRLSTLYFFEFMKRNLFFASAIKVDSPTAADSNSPSPKRDKRPISQTFKGPRYYSLILLFFVVVIIQFGFLQIIPGNIDGRILPSLKALEDSLQYGYDQFKTNRYYVRKVISPKRIEKSSFDSNIGQDNSVSIIFMAGNIRYSHPGYYNFIKSLKFAGYRSVLKIEPNQGTQEILSLKKTNLSAETFFWVKRLSAFEEASREFEPHRILLFCDSFDILFGLPPEILIQRYVQLNKPVIFSTEVFCDTTSCRQDSGIKEWYQGKNNNKWNPYKYLNAGMFVGKASDLNFVLKCAVRHAKNGRDDQSSFSLCFKEFPDIIGLDYDSQLFGNFPPLDIIFNTAWNVRAVDDIEHGVNEDYRKSLWATLDSDTVIKYSEMLSISPLFHRKQYDLDNSKQKNDLTLSSPVAIHFPGMAYRPNSYIPFNPCQQNLRWRYNDLGSLMFRNSQRPFLFHPIPNEILKSFRDSRIVLALSVQLTQEGNLKNVVRTLRSASGFTWPPHTIYVHVHETSRSSSIDKAVRESYIHTIRTFPTVKLSVSKGVSGAAQRTAFLEALQAESQPNTIIALLDANYQYDGDILERLASSLIRNPVNAYGAEGWLVEEEVEDEEEARPPSDPEYLTHPEPPPSASTSSFGQFRRTYRMDGADKSGGKLLHLRSAVPVSLERALAVDVLRLSGGLVVRREFFVLNDFLKWLGRVVTREHGVLPFEDMYVGAYLSLRGVPRFQLMDDGSGRIPVPWAEVDEALDTLDEIPPHQAVKQERTVTRRVGGPPSVTGGVGSSFTTTQAYLHPLLLSLYPYFAKSFVLADNFTGVASPVSSPSSSIFSAEEEDVVHSYDFTFHEIPPVSDLNGFAWKANWERASDTCPCTAHLMTKLVDSGAASKEGEVLSYYLGEGQYMSEGQEIHSPDRRFRVTLEDSDRAKQLCLYSDGNRQRCIALFQPSTSPPTGLEKHSYLALDGGDLCLFLGQSPHFGGTKEESGHRATLTCMSSVLSAVNNSVLEIATEDKPVEFQQQPIPEKYYEYLYFHVSNDGVLGLFISANNAHDMLLPLERTSGFSCVRRF